MPMPNHGDGQNAHHQHNACSDRFKEGRIGIEILIVERTRPSPGLAGAQEVVVQEMNNRASSPAARSSRSEQQDDGGCAGMQGGRGSGSGVAMASSGFRGATGGRAVPLKCPPRGAGGTIPLFGRWLFTAGAGHFARGVGLRRRQRVVRNDICQQRGRNCRPPCRCLEFGDRDELTAGMGMSWTGPFAYWRR